MDENKNLVPENENPEDNKMPEIAEAVAEKIEEEAVIEEIEEEAVAEEIEEEAVAEETTTNVKDTAEGTTETVHSSKKSNGIIAAIIGVAVAVILALILAVTFLAGGKSDAGTGNLYSLGFAAVDGKDIYHISFSDYLLYKTNTKTGESVKISDDSPMYICNYKGDIYYLTMVISEDMMDSSYQFKKYVDGENDVVIFTDPDAISMPQISDGYIYYMKSVPEYNSGYSSRVYRAKIEEGSSPELCLDILCNSFYVEGNDLYYSDVDTAYFMKTSLSKSIKLIADSPLPEGVLRSSAELESEVIVQTILSCPVIYKNTLYFIDSYNQSELCTYNLKTGEVSGFNNGIYTPIYNIYGDFIYYYNLQDFSFYRMRLDGSDVTKVSGINYYGYIILVEDMFMSLDISLETGTQYISVCDLDGNPLFNLNLPEEGEIFYDESAIPEEELLEESEEESIDTTIDMEE